MILLKDLWINIILPKLSPIDLVNFQLVSKHCFGLVPQPRINEWKIFTRKVTVDGCLLKAVKTGHADLGTSC